jgi:hypothetical protein
MDINQHRRIRMELVLKAFSDFGCELHTIEVELGDSPCVFVWDSVGNLFTSNHDISLRTQRKIIAAARARAAAQK